MINERKISDVSDALLAVLNGWLHNDMREVNLDLDATDLFIDLVERNRFDALMWVALPEGKLRDSLGDHLQLWRSSYEQCLVRNMRQLHAALKVYAQLEAAGIPSVCLRGPFSGASLYDDIALRYFTDIDLLIPADKRDLAWDILIEAGFKFSHSFMTPSACVHHHLEWPFRNDASGVSVDLHWAVDHPYKLYKIDYDELFRESYIYSCRDGEWRRPSINHEIILASIHLEKECRHKGCKYSAEVVRNDSAAGLLRHGLDLAILIRSEQSVDWDAVLSVAAEWHVQSAVRSAIDMAHTVFSVEIPQSVLLTLEKECGDVRAVQSSRSHSKLDRVLDKYGFRGECLSDACGYLIPPVSYFSDQKGMKLLRSRIAHTVRAVGKLSAGCAEMLWLRARQLWVRVMTKRTIASVAIIMLFACPLWAHDFGDDVGDGSSDAETLIVNGAGVERVIEIDQDEDWFVFEVKPYIDYVVAVSNVTLFDATANRYSGNSITIADATNTLPYSVDVEMDWAGPQLLARAYVRISGMFEFTTGTYNIAVSGSMLDTDLDGLPDAWEQEQFSNLLWSATDDPDGDDVNNNNEWLLNTGPMDSNSCFRVNDILATNDNLQVTWQSSTGGWYSIQYSSNLLDASGWHLLETNIDSAEGVRYYTNSLDGLNGCRFYRVMYEY